MPPRAIRSQLLVAALAATAVAIVAGCATTMQQEIAHEPPTSIETVSYFPFLVKGYQNSYPRRRILVLVSVDVRDFKDAAGQSHEPDNGNPAIGVILGPDGSLVQRVYSPPLGPTLQAAIVRAADEAGMLGTASDDTLDSALKENNEDYVLVSRIRLCWVNKHAGPDTNGSPSAGAAWFTAANTALDVTIYKPPFNVAFWQGESAATYNDPPADNGTGMGDNVAIYDRPSQVLSVALTRAVAGIFKREALHALIMQDAINTH